MRHWLDIGLHMIPMHTSIGIPLLRQRQTVQNFTNFPSNVCSLDAFASDIGPYSHSPLEYHFHGYAKYSTVLLISSQMFVV